MLVCHIQKLYVLICLFEDSIFACICIQYVLYLFFIQYECRGPSSLSSMDVISGVPQLSALVDELDSIRSLSQVSGKSNRKIPGRSQQGVQGPTRADEGILI